MHQRRQITSIRLAYHSHGLLDWDVFHLDEFRAQLERLLPNLSTMEIVIKLARIAVYREDIVTHIEAVLRQCDSKNTLMNVKVRVLDSDSKQRGNIWYV